MKKFLFALIPLLLLCTGCSVTTPACQKSAEYTGKKIKTGFYVDEGSRGTGVLHIARLLKFSPQIELTFLTGKDLREGKLNGLDLFVMPGGSSEKQMVSMGPKGVKALQDFVRNGGSYVGVCAGFHITLNRPERAELVPYTYLRKSVGNRADVQINLSKEGAELLDVRPGKRLVRYSRGPIAKENHWNKGDCKTYASYTSSVGPLGRPGTNFFGTPALIAGNYGKGKLIATSFHPEYRIDTYELFIGCVYAVTGVKITPQIPAPKFRALRVLYHHSIGRNHLQTIPAAFALERNIDNSMLYVLDPENLAVSDVLFLPDTTKEKSAALEKNFKYLKKFMDRGGKVIAAGSAWNIIPEHRNLKHIPADKCPVKAVKEIAAEK